MKSKKLRILMLIAVLVIALLPTTAFAISDTQDGVKMELTSDKAAYKAGDIATIKAVVTNTNAYGVSDVKLSFKLPAAFELKSGSTSISAGNMAAGEVKEFTITALAKTATSSKDISSSPKTGDSFPLATVIILIVTAAGITVLLLLKKKKAVKIFSLMLCFVLVLAVTSPIASAADKPSTISVDLGVTVNGADVIIGSTVSFVTSVDTDTGEEYEIEVVTGSTSQGNPPQPKSTASANLAKAKAGETVTITAQTAEGEEFSHWHEFGDFEVDDKFAATTTFIMPDSRVIVYAYFYTGPEEGDFTVTINVNDPEQGYASADMVSANEEDTITLSATAIEPYFFSHWEANVAGGSFSSETDPYATYQMPGSNVVLTAYFASMP